MWGGIKIPPQRQIPRERGTDQKGKWGNPHNLYQLRIMWGFALLCRYHGNHSNWLADVSCCAQCRFCYVGYWFFTCCRGPFIACISWGFSGTQPSCTLTVHLVLDDFEGQEMERSGDSCDKTLKVSEMVLILWKPEGVKKSMRLDSVIKSNLYQTCYETLNNCDFAYYSCTIYNVY